MFADPTLLARLHERVDALYNAIIAANLSPALTQTLQAATTAYYNSLSGLIVNAPPPVIPGATGPIGPPVAPTAATGAAKVAAHAA